MCWNVRSETLGWRNLIKNRQSISVPRVGKFWNKLSQNVGCHTSVSPFSLLLVHYFFVLDWKMGAWGEDQLLSLQEDGIGHSNIRFGLGLQGFLPKNNYNFSCFPGETSSLMSYSRPVKKNSRRKKWKPFGKIPIFCCHFGLKRNWIIDSD